MVAPNVSKCLIQSIESALLLRQNSQEVDIEWTAIGCSQDINNAVMAVLSLHVQRSALPRARLQCRTTAIVLTASFVSCHIDLDVHEVEETEDRQTPG